MSIKALYHLSLLLTITCKGNKMKWSIPVVLFVILCSAVVFAYPSGGPYGPIQKNYIIPRVPGTVYYVAPDGNPDIKGQDFDAPTTIEAAIKRVTTKDAIVMRGGVYRTGDLKLNQGITIQPYKDEQPVLKGTRVASDWEDLRNGLWRTSWSRLFPSKPDNWWRRHRHGRTTPLHRFNNDMVFVDGRFLQSAGWEGEVDENTFYINYDAGEVYIGVDPADKLVEITAYDSALTQVAGECNGKASDHKGPTIRGITFTQYAYRAIEIEGKYPQGPSKEANHGKDIVGTTFEHCAITFCSRVAGYFKGDNLKIKNCLISDTSTEGIYIISSNDILLEKNILRRNNIENIDGYYPAAVKIFNQCYRATCRDNFVTDLPNSNGIWYDVGEVDGRIVNNWFQNVGHTSRDFSYRHFWPSQNAFFFEISKGAIVAGNVFVNCDQGMFVLNSCDVKMYQNTLINSTACIGRTARSAQGDHFGWHPSTGPDVNERDGHVFVNNLMVTNEKSSRPLLAFSQQENLCDRLQQPQVEKLDYNVYVQGPKAADNPLILWSPAQQEHCRQMFETLDDFRKAHSGFAANSRQFDNYSGPLFKGWQLGNFQLLEAFAAAKTAAKLPVEVAKLLGLSEEDAPFVGAYPPVR